MPLSEADEKDKSKTINIANMVKIAKVIPENMFMTLFIL